MIDNYDSVDVFIGVDVGKGEHHAVALDRAGKVLFDKALPNEEAKLRALIGKLDRGEGLARSAGRLVAGYDFSLVLTSQLQRARRTAELAGLQAEVDPLLVEWDYGGYEGRTTRDIRSRPVCHGR